MPENEALETAAEQPSGRRPWETTLGMALIWGAVLGGAVFAVGFLGGFALYPGSNLAPIWGFLLGPPAFLAGLVAGALLARSCRWKQSLLLLAGTAMLASLALLSYLWIHRTQDDSEILADRLDTAARQLSRSDQTEKVLAFQPPTEAGSYEIRVDGGKAWSLSVDYPRTERGPSWGQGRAWQRPNLKAPVTLSKEKAAGELTEIVLRKHAGEVDLTELR